MTVNYREAYGMFAASGILFNHESPMRGRQFVTRKITDTVAKIRLGGDHVLELGNLDARRDWGYAKEYVDGMWRMLQTDSADSYVLATGRTETVRTFAGMAFAAADMQVEWLGDGADERAVDKRSGRVLVRVNPRFQRPAEVDLLQGDASKARELLGWNPSTSLESLCQMMVEADLHRNEHGYSF